MQRAHHMQGSHRNHLVTKHGTVLANGLLVSTVCDSDFWTHFSSIESATALHQQAWGELDRPFSEAIQLDQEGLFTRDELEHAGGVLDNGIAVLVDMDSDGDGQVEKKEAIFYYRKMMNGVAPYMQLQNYEYYATVDHASDDIYNNFMDNAGLYESSSHDVAQYMHHRFGRKLDELGTSLGFQRINSGVLHTDYDSDGDGEVTNTDLNPFLYGLDGLWPAHIESLTAAKAALEQALGHPSRQVATQQLRDFSTQQLVAVENPVSFLDSIKHFLGTVVLYCCPLGACAVALSAVRRRQERGEQSQALLVS